MAFKFSLATVLRVRVIREEREEQMLQQILHKIKQTLLACSEIDTEMASLNAARATELFQQVPGRQLHGAYSEVQRLRQSRKDLEDQIEKLEQLKDMQFAIYQTARRDREMLTDMCEQKRHLYAVDLARREQNTLDDNFIARRLLT